MTTLHEKLKSARLALVLSQDEFAEQLGEPNCLSSTVKQYAQTKKEAQA